MTVTVCLFARARELAGTSSLSLELPAGVTVGEFRRRLAEVCPRLAGLLAHCAIAVDSDFAPDVMVIPPSAEVALLPPVSGG
jgi:molybdopterin converting factor subunit 1